MTATVAIIAGGTGGHVFPALAVARYLRERQVGIVWIGTRRGLEARVVPANGFDMEYIRIRGLRGRGLLGWLLLPVNLAIAVWQSAAILRRRKVRAVLAMGGFVAGPGGLAAWMLRRPLIIHEQNAIAGFTNRWLARVADQVLSGFPRVFSGRPGARDVGNPVRHDILALPTPQQRLHARNGPCRVLVVGGSLGAQVFNDVLPVAVQRLAAEERPEIWHQTGQARHTATAAAYARAGVTPKVTAFIEDMAAAYAWADVVICRAGAMTVAELAAAGVASVLVPFPFATDDHQTANARFLAERDAAVLLPQADFTPERVAELLRTLAQSRAVLLRMAEQARALATSDATEIIGGLCLEALHA